MFDLAKEEILEDVEPLLVDLADAFELAIVQSAALIEQNFPNAGDGYLKSGLVRASVKEQLIREGYDLAPVANVGIEVIFNAKYSVKVVRSDHRSNAPAPSTISRAAWYSIQPRLGTVDVDPDVFWSVKNLGLRGCDIDKAILNSLSAQDDGLTHLLVDWEDVDGLGVVRMAVSMPTGVWKPGETPKLAWRSVFERKGDLKPTAFIPTDEDIDIFVDGDNGESRLGVKVG